MRFGWLVPALLWGAGAALVALAVLRGEATVGVAFVIPFVAGQSALLLLGILLLCGGFFALPFGFASPDPALAAGPPVDRDRSGSIGGVVLIGPFPLFFGSWKSASRRVRIAAAVVGGVLTVVLVVALVLSLH